MLELMICPNCFKQCRNFVLDQLPDLQSVKIGKNCFKSDEKQPQIVGNFSIKNCTNLLTLEFGDESFHNFRTFELINVNSLQYIDIGCSCFVFADLKIKGIPTLLFNYYTLDLPSLENIRLNQISFSSCHLCIFDSIALLRFSHFY